jgi:hypothetical protein
MEMINHGLAPGMENGENPWFPFKPPLWISGKGEDCFFYGMEQICQEFTAVCKNQWIQKMSNGKDKVIIATGEQFFPSFIQPSFLGQGLAFWTVAVSV